jgi:hypothetical protein
LNTFLLTLLKGFASGGGERISPWPRGGGDALMTWLTSWTLLSRGQRQVVNVVSAVNEVRHRCPALCLSFLINMEVSAAFILLR